MKERFDEFTVTEEHLKLLRAAYVGWDGCEFGAPAIDCKRPYGNSSVILDIAEILELRTPGGFITPEHEEELRQLHRETKTALQVGLSTGQFKPGRYRTPKYRREWEPVA